jgi:hypothetical protein
VKGEFFCRKIDSVCLKGKGLPTDLYEVFSKKGKETDVFKSWKKRHESALERYVRGDFASAYEQFEHNRQVGKDPVAETFLKRMESMGKVAPKDWNGIFSFDSK